MSHPTHRLDAAFARLRADGETGLGLFLTCGFPTPEATLPILLEADRAGADFIELGMPFSDPVAEGLPIQQASERALAQGVGMDDVLATARAFREASDTPLLLMGYANPVLRYGVGDFCAAAASAGVDGLILPDLPPEEADELDAAAAHHALRTVYLVAPNTRPERVAHVAARATGFVYAVSQAGLTGAALADADATAAYLARVRETVHAAGLPLCVGFGIRTPEDAARLGRAADAVIVGSALIRLAAGLWDDGELSPNTRLAHVNAWASALKAGALSPAP